jgi:FdhD protein
LTVVDPLFLDLGRAHSESPAPGDPALVTVPVRTVDGPTRSLQPDQLAVEEPLEITLHYGPEGQRVRKSLSITMRTPGHDLELAAGFLLTEGLIRDKEDLVSLRPCGPAVGPRQLHNVVRVELRPHVSLDLKRLERHFHRTSSCGVCGKASLEALDLQAPATLPEQEPLVPSAVIHQLPARLREAQAVFERTGGLHAAALFDAEGGLHALREDVGRHNAVDKLIGAQLLEQRLPLHNRLIFVSGRASFELMQKALMAGAPMLAAVGAPSSLAVDLAQRFRMTLLGFVRESRFNIYCGDWRIL